MSRQVDIAGKRTLITGASSGIGWATAKAFGAAGARLTITARRRQRLEGLASVITGEGGTTPLVVDADLSRRGEAARVATSVREAMGGVDILVNNAGGGVGGMVWAVGDGDEARQQFEVDVWAPLALIHELVPDMRRRREGTIVNVTSLRQVFSWPGMGHSSGANAAMAIITESLRLELLRFGVHVIDVVPGPVNTPAQGPTKLLPGITEAVHARFGTAEPEEVAARIVAAVEAREPFVFCPESARAAYDDPVAFRAAMRVEVEALLGDLPLDEAGETFLDTFVAGNDDPLLMAARQQWEEQQQLRR